MMINKKYLEDFKDITKYLTKEEIKYEVKDYIDLNFAIPVSYTHLTLPTNREV